MKASDYVLPGGRYEARGADSDSSVTGSSPHDAPPEGTTEYEVWLADFLQACLKQSADVVSCFRQSADEADRFFNSHQWDEADVTHLKNQSRAPLTINRVARYVNAIAGLEVQNRQRCFLTPRNPDLEQVAGVAQLATDVYQWALDNCDGDDERGHAFADLVNRGMGWMNKWIDTEIAEDGKFIYERVDGMEMGWDPSARRRNLEDANWVYRRRYARLLDVIEKWPDKEDDVKASSETGISPIDTLDMPTSIINKTFDKYAPGSQTTYPADNSMNSDGDFVLLTELQWRERETVYKVRDPFGDTEELVELSEEELKILKKRLPTPPVYVKMSRWRYKRMFSCKGVILSHGDLPIEGEFTYTCMTYMWDTKDKIWYGITRLLVDPQRGTNKYISQAIAIFSASPKGTLLIESDAMVNSSKLADNWASPGGVIQLRPNANQQGKFQVINTPPLSTAAVQLAQIFDGGFKEASGLEIDALAGGVPGDTGVAMRQRQQQSTTILATAFQALTRFRRQEALSVIKWVTEFLADGRIVRIGGPDDAAYIPLLKDDLTYEFDVQVDENAMNANTKMEVWTSMQPIFPVLIRNDLFLPEMWDFAPLPQSLIKGLKQRMEMVAKQKAMAAEKEQQMGMGGGDPPELTAAKIHEMDARAQLSQIKAQAILLQSKLDAMESGLTMQQAEAEQKMDLAKLVSDLATDDEGRKNMQADRATKATAAHAGIQHESMTSLGKMLGDLGKADAAQVSAKAKLRAATAKASSAKRSIKRSNDIGAPRS